MMTYREKTAAASLAITTRAFAAYGFWAFQQPRSTGEAVQALVGIIVAQIVVQIIVHILFAIQGRPEGVDERDRMVERLAQRNAYFVLFGSIWAVLGMALEALPGLTIAYGLLATLVLAELVRFASQLFYYRRGA